MKKTAFILIIIIFFLTAFSACNFNDRSMGFVFGTSYELEISGLKANRAKKEIISILEDIELTLSTNIKTSDVYKINHSLVNTPVAVSRLTMDMFNQSRILFNETDGKFNAAIFPIVRLFGFSPDSDTEEKTPPKNNEITEILPYCNFDYFVADEENMTLMRTSEYAMLDFGAVAKGYAVQESLSIIKGYGIKRAIVNIGGTVGNVGKSIKVGIKSPRESDKKCFASFELDDGLTAATSGDYERYYIYQGIRYHHIMDSERGMPVYNGIIGVTIVTSDGTLSDILSTSVFCMGAKKGMDYAVSKGAKCLIIMDDGSYYLSKGFDVKIAEEGYTKADINAAS